MFTALLVMIFLAVLLGLVLGYSAIKFKVDGDPMVARIDAILPQTQCGQCGYPGCKPYATAIAKGEADINQCPPGGDTGAKALAELMGVEFKPLNQEHGVQKPKSVALIDESTCIGCTLCIQACPVDAILGAAKQMHTIIASECTGCELCLPPCPVDCITLVPAHPEPVPTGWAAWSPEQADEARARHTFRATRIARAKADNDVRLLAKGEHKLQDLAAASKLTDPVQLDHKRSMIEAALARARSRRGQS